MQHRFQGFLAASAVCGLAAAMACLPPAHSEPRPHAAGRLPLLPVFSTAQDGPEFVAQFENQTGQVVNIVELMETSSIVLDGKTYKRQVVRFVGNSSLRPGESIPFTVDTDGYLLGSERKEFSETLKRWRWKSSLVSGRHTLLLNLGGREYGPLSFVWDADAPLLTK